MTLPGVFSLFRSSCSMPQRYERSPFGAVILGILFHVAVFFLLWSYMKTIFTNTWVSAHERPLSMRGVTLNPCQKCGVPKPPRAHHCSMCQTCVLKMDHHCTLFLCALSLKPVLRTHPSYSWELVGYDDGNPPGHPERVGTWLFGEKWSGRSFEQTI